MSTEVLLEAQDLSYAIAGKLIIHNISLSLRRGEIVGLIGPNGAGKSTLLKCLMGYYNYDGMLYAGGRNFGGIRGTERAKLIAYVSQQGLDHISFSALEVVEMGCYQGLYTNNDPSNLVRAEKALEYVGLADCSRRAFNQLSGGEQQLVLFARVMAQDTPILLLDEPTANLDIGHEKTVLEMVTELGKEGKASIIAIHNLNMAAEFCNKLLLMKNGGIEIVGTPDEVLMKEHLQAVYQTDLNIFQNPGSGNPQVYPLRKFHQHQNIQVHIIGGAGGGVNITRFLIRSGLKVSGGVAHRLDADTYLWKSLGIPMVSVEPFSEIDDTAYAEALQLVKAAEYTILCSFPIGRGNQRNLALAAEAKQLLIIQDGQRNFHTQEAHKLFEQIQNRSIVLNSTEIEDFFITKTKHRETSPPPTTPPTP